jgi:DNA-binding MltR family transcriptional regulator
MSENVQLKRMYGQRNKLKMKLMSYYLGEMDSEELEEFNRDQFYKKLLKTEVETYIEADDLFIEMNLKVVMQEEKVNYLENVLKSINSRGFQIKNAIDWIKFTHG